MTIEMIPDSTSSRDDTTLETTINDEILDGLQRHCGPDAIIRGYTARLRKDYCGPASHKVRCGGALVVTTDMVCHRDGAFTATYEIDDNHRPFSEDLISKLGALAESTWYQNPWIRDYPSDPRA